MGLVVQARSTSSWRPTLVDEHALDEVKPQLDTIAGDRCKVILQRTVATSLRNPCMDKEMPKEL